MTSNPEKIAGVEAAGITVEAEPVLVKESSRNVLDLYKTKAKKFGHLSISKVRVNLHGIQELERRQHGVGQLGDGIIAAPRQQKALEPLPETLDPIQVRAIRRQVLQRQALLRPPGARLLHGVRPVERRVVQDHDDRGVGALGLRRELVQVGHHHLDPTGSRHARVLQPLGFARQTQGADEIDPALRAPSTRHPMLVAAARRRPGCRGRQTQRHAALVQVAQHQLAMLRPFFSRPRVSRAARSCSGSGGLLGT